MNIQEQAYWNNNTYGKSVMIPKNVIRSCIIALGIIVPVIIPVPLCVWVSSKVKSNYRWCY